MSATSILSLSSEYGSLKRLMSLKHRSVYSIYEMRGKRLIAILEPPQLWFEANWGCYLDHLTLNTLNLLPWRPRVEDAYLLGSSSVIAASAVNDD